MCSRATMLSRLEPPYETNGSVMPVTGSIPNNVCFDADPQRLGGTICPNPTCLAPRKGATPRVRPMASNP